MDIIKAIILGLVQGATEFLPVSSSGHLSLFQHFLGVTGEGSLLFSVMLHLGTLAAVIIVYYQTIWELFLEAIKLIGDIIHRKFKFKKMSETRRMLVMLFVSCIPLLFLLIPTGDEMILLDRVSVFSEDSSILAEGVCFLFTAVLLILSSYLSGGKRLRKKVNTLDAGAIGVAQALAAALPGVSRSGATISTGLICGVSKQYIVKYSFILGIPAILAANAVEFKQAYEMGETIDPVPLLFGVITAAVFGVFCIKLLKWLLKKDMFKYFGYYCFIIGVITIIIAIIEKLSGAYIGIQQ
ncbi:MAG: Undecaprenyl-diphosphatase [Firmicutes bacterium ADurb.Bin300]|nr:MAG: Undecaprenyl-diphosphatase [Firmicutes bacterium ADurb.Bin300]